MGAKELRKEMFENPGMAGKKHSINWKVIKMMLDGQERMDGAMKSHDFRNMVVLPPKIKK